jgi:hypothetical protein
VIFGFVGGVGCFEHVLSRPTTIHYDTGDKVLMRNGFAVGVVEPTANDFHNIFARFPFVATAASMLNMGLLKPF